MKRLMATLAASAFLVACSASQNPFRPADEADPGTGDPTTGSASDIPASLANDLSRFSYDPVAQTLTVEGITLDNVPFTATYARKPGLDRAGYEAYTVQNDPLDRHVTAYVGETNNNSGARAGITVSGGIRNRFFGGGYYERTGTYSAPDVTATTGLVSYAGNYVGLINVAGTSEDLLPVPGGTPSELVPTQAAEVTGEIFLNADFADGAVEGNIYNRQIVDNGQALPSIVLVSAAITADGTFHGTEVEFEAADFPGENVVGVDIGDYGGVFAGTDAAGVAGVVHLEQWDGPNDPLGFEGEEEYGVFVLDQCGQPVDAAICSGVNP